MTDVVSDRRAPTVPRQAAAALALRLAGASYAEVADALSLPSAEVARDQAEAALAARAWQDKAGREAMRQENAARIERLLRSVWQKATNASDPEHLPAVKVALTLVDRLVRLHGLDAPAEIIVHNPTTAEIDQWVAQMIATQTAHLRNMEPQLEPIEAVAHD